MCVTVAFDILSNAKQFTFNRGQLCRCLVLPSASIEAARESQWVGASSVRSLLVAMPGAPSGVLAPLPLQLSLSGGKGKRTFSREI